MDLTGCFFLCMMISKRFKLADFYYLDSLRFVLLAILVFGRVKIGFFWGFWVI